MNKTLETVRDGLLTNVAWYILTAVASSVAVIATTWIGLVEGLPIAYLIPATILSAGAVPWMLNQISQIQARTPESEALVIANMTGELVTLRDCSDKVGLLLMVSIINVTGRVIKYERVETTAMASKVDKTAPRNPLARDRNPVGDIGPHSTIGYETTIVVDDIHDDTIIGEFKMEVKFGRKDLKHERVYERDYQLIKNPDGTRRFHVRAP